MITLEKNSLLASWLLRGERARMLMSSALFLILIDRKDFFAPKVQGRGGGAHNIQPILYAHFLNDPLPSAISQNLIIKQYQYS